jgi:peptidoglycan/LPS O-acetylase OafA/YrhL
MTTKAAPQRVGFLDHFRGIAILAVFLGHALNMSIGENLGDPRQSLLGFLCRLAPVLLQCFCDAGVPIFLSSADFAST